VDLQLRPGAFIRIKPPVVIYVSTEELYLLASVDQRAVQWIRLGDEAHFSLSMHPGRVFKAVYNPF
jgi:multidrug resistance efflux pump